MTSYQSPKKSILITGAAGYIGSHTAVELITAGYRVILVDNFSNSDISSIQGIESITGQKVIFEQADCCDKLAMREIFKKQSIDAIIHFAAYKAVGESVSEPLKYYRNNLGSLITILEMAEEFGVKFLLFSSSATVYGQPSELPVTEQTPTQRATSPYGHTKQISEDILVDCVNTTNNFNVISLRYFNPIGAHDSALIGELPKGIPNNLVPYITQTAAGIREQISVFGHNYNTPDGSPVRDYIDIVDLAKAHIIAINRLMVGGNKSQYEIFNIGTGSGISVLELIHKFEASTGIKLNYKLTDRRHGDVEQIWTSTDLANQELGWKAERTLGDTLASAWAWEKHLRGIK